MISREVVITKLPSKIVLEGLLQFRSNKNCKLCYGQGLILRKGAGEKEAREVKCGCVKVICPLCKSHVLINSKTVTNAFHCPHCGDMHLGRPKQKKAVKSKIITDIRDIQGTEGLLGKIIT